MSIKPLNKQTITLLKSTQVITSLYSVVKELVENSLDAGAKNIDVTLVDNGLSLIEVRDDGCGINPVDAKYMALPSYTSKITDFKDLDFLSSYGFRGEGLNAICKVAEVTVSTKTAEEIITTRYELDHDGCIVRTDSSHGLIGTIIQVRNIFKNMPVRRKILTTNNKTKSDIKNIEFLLKAFAICQPPIRLTFKVNQKLIFTKLRCKTFSDAVKYLLGHQLFEKMECLDKNFGQIEITLVIPKKDQNDNKDLLQNGIQFICVNNRPIKSKDIEKKINKRITEYFDSTTSSQKSVFCLFVKVPSTMLDVNLEPNKDKVIIHNQSLVIGEIDTLIVKYYNLQISQSSQDSNAENMSNLSINVNSSELDNDSEKDYAASRKKSNKNQENTRSIEEFEKNLYESDFIKEIRGPRLSDSESNHSEDNLENGKTKKRKLNETELEQDEVDLSDFQNKKRVTDSDAVQSQLLNVDLGEDFDVDKILDRSNRNNTSKIVSDVDQSDNSADQNIELQSQLLDVDLGEDFDVEEILNKSRLNNVSSEQNILRNPLFTDQLNSGNQCSIQNKCKQENNYNDIAAWSRGCIPGLNPGIAIVTNGNLLNRNQESRSIDKLQECTRTDSELFDYLPEVQKQITAKLSDENKQMDHIDIPQVNEFVWKNPTPTKSKDKTPLKKSILATPSSTRSETKKRLDFTPGKSDYQPVSQCRPKQEELFGGGDAGLGINSVSTFAVYCKEIRPEILKENPNFSNAEVAALMQSRWKSMSSEERGYYRDLATQNVRNNGLIAGNFTQSTPSQKVKKEISETEKIKNRKRLVNMLENMKVKKRDEKNMILRTSVPWHVNINTVSEKFKNKVEFKAVGSLRPFLWIINHASKLSLCNMNNISKQLGKADLDVNQLNYELVQNMIEQWLLKEENLEELYTVYDLKSFNELET